MNICIHFQKQLDFFRVNDKPGRQFNYVLSRKTSVKDIIESLGIPHTEVGQICFNKQEIDFSYIPVSRGILDVRAVTPPFNVGLPSLLRPQPLECIRFVADVNVIKLGRLLILLGFDVIYSPSYSDEEIADIAEKENRIVLTRDTDLLKRSKIVFARRIRANLPYDQLAETIHFFGLENMISFFSRCTACNIKLVAIEKKDVMHLLEPKTKQYFNTFFQCPQCRTVFWRGSHYDNIQTKMASLGILINH